MFAFFPAKDFKISTPICNSKQYTPKEVSFSDPLMMKPGEEFLKFQLKACGNGIILLIGIDGTHLYCIIMRASDVPDDRYNNIHVIR